MQRFLSLSAGRACKSAPERRAKPCTQRARVPTELPLLHTAVGGRAPASGMPFPDLWTDAGTACAILEGGGEGDGGPNLTRSTLFTSHMHKKKKKGSSEMLSKYYEKKKTRTGGGGLKIERIKKTIAFSKKKRMDQFCWKLQYCNKNNNKKNKKKAIHDLRLCRAPWSTSSPLLWSVENSSLPPPKKIIKV